MSELPLPPHTPPGTPPGTSLGTSVRPSRGLERRLVLRRFLRHRLAVGSLVVLVVVGVAAVFSESLSPHAFDDADLTRRGIAPTLEGWHLFGTDKIGRDYFSRVLHGTRTSLGVALVVAALSTAIGATIGAVAGYYGGRIDNLLMRFTDFVLAVPGLAVLLVAAAFLGAGSALQIAVLISLLLWTTIARIVRGNCLSLREREFVDAARAAGAGDGRIIFRHILPNTIGPIIVNATLVVALAILLEATLSFLGFGVQPPAPALGKLIDEGKGAMFTDWWLVAMPGLVIMVICLAVNFVGDGLRDALDPFQPRRATQVARRAVVAQK